MNYLKGLHNGLPTWTTQNKTIFSHILLKRIIKHDMAVMAISIRLSCTLLSYVFFSWKKLPSVHSQKLYLIFKAVMEGNVMHVIADVVI